MASGAFDAATSPDWAPAFTGVTGCAGSHRPYSHSGTRSAARIVSAAMRSATTA